MIIMIYYVSDVMKHNNHTKPVSKTKSYLVTLKKVILRQDAQLIEFFYPKKCNPIATAAATKQ